ncbi:unnamed protein product [Brassica oleracea var. botrytis]|uniref:(rape) hypothetical protein n=1 Tax=Brassica napus TaxID=3708 RepID=A0A816TXM3_BRANA|nr:unnamed protein product [Brassica napus]
MFPRWDFDVEDSAAENIIKVMFNAKSRWKWTIDCWEVTGTKPSEKKEVNAVETESGVKEERGRPRKKARKEKSVEARAEASKVAPTEARSEASTTVGGMTEEEIAKKLQGRQSGEPSVLVLDKGAPTVSDLKQGEARRQTKKAMAMKFVRGKRERERKLANPHQSPFKGNSTAKLIIPNKRVGQGYDPFAPFHKKMSKMLTDLVKLDPYYKTPMAKKQRRCPILGVDVDDIYALVNFRNEHWIAIWISIPKTHIVVWDSIISHISREELDVVMEPFVTMVPYLLFCNKNAKAIREKMALDIFKETPKCHEKENEDNDENMGTYDEQGRRGVKSSGRLTRRSPSTYKPCVASGVCVLSS